MDEGEYSFPPPALSFPGFELREFFVKLNDPAVIVARFAVHFQGLHDFHHLAREGKGHTDVMARLDGVRQILDVQFDPEAGL